MADTAEDVSLPIHLLGGEQSGSNERKVDFDERLSAEGHDQLKKKV